MFDWVQPLLNAMNAALAAGPALAVLAGLGMALAGTQFMKFQLKAPSRRTLNLIALGFGAATTFFMWPVHEINAVRVCLSILVGLGAPPVYKGGTALLFWKWPDLEKRFSPQKEPNDA